MLRASADAAAVSLDLTAIGDSSKDPGREDAKALLAFTDALINRTDGLDAARERVVEVLGHDAVVPASGSAGNFEMMNRVLDAAGIPVPASMKASVGPMIGVSA